MLEIVTSPLFLVPAAVLIAGGLLAMRLARRPGGVLRPRRPSATHTPKVTFADVAGLDEAIEDLREVRDYLADPQRFRALGAELPRGILLYGPPGCGKTLLARALAGEAGVPFYAVSAASFVERFVGLGAARVRKLFEEAKAQAPSIVFLDELDAIGRARSDRAPGEREFDHTLNQLLVELDGYLRTPGVLILAATNRPELIDPALLRPGRFDRRIRIDPPDRQGRAAILRLHAMGRPFSRQVDWDDVADRAAGLNGAELAHVVNEAALLAARRHRPRISNDDVLDALDRVLLGTRRAGVLGPDERRLEAVHQAGHALLSVRLKHVSPPARISVLPTTGSFEHSLWARGTEGSALTKRELMAQLIVLLGGRAAEINTFGEPSTRAEDDLRHAGLLARAMVERWAMTGSYELAASDAGSERADVHVRKLIAQAQEAARSILADHAEQHRAIAQLLVERETITADELRAAVARTASFGYGETHADSGGGQGRRW